MNPLRPAARVRAVVGLALTQLRRAPGRTVLTVVAIALAVLSVTLLVSLGVGVFEAGQERLDESNRDIWITSDPLDSSSGGTENAIVDSHAVAADVHEREDVRFATPIAMHSTYVGTDPDDLEPVTAVGIPETHGGFDFEHGGGFSLEDYHGEDVDDPAASAPDVIVLDPAFAAAIDASVGDTVYVGTSRETAPNHEYTVVGISGHYSAFLGSPAVTMPLTELQGVAGTSGTDRAVFVTVDVAEGADRTAVRNDLAATYPAYDVRTSDEQLGAMIQDRALVVASGVTLVALAVCGGLLLTVNLFVLVAYQQRDELAALRAIGLSRWLLAGTIAVQGFVIGLLGGLVALVATPPAVLGLNRLVASLVGFEQLLRTPPEVYAVGGVIALVVGTVAAAVTGWRAGRYARLERLEV
ncbi:ABC transporter permease [Natronobeatus ordinarius]|uniref:ABC transporter permease n=1 Tax=Natronobeatus ordinarius TaxID=2963433 RepID=UPI0020CBCD97|nr:ABC transporter permease [Natronobeatus ordinarius]